MYLEEDAIRHLLHTLCRLFPRHKLVCDLMDRRFFEKYSRTLHEKITGMGTKFIITDKPDEIFIKNGYRCVERVSIVGQASAWGSVGIPGILMRLFLHTLAHGYAVRVFES